MYMFAKFGENPAMTLQDIKETKHYGRTYRQHKNSIPTTKFVGHKPKTLYKKPFRTTKGNNSNRIGPSPYFFV